VVLKKLTVSQQHSNTISADIVWQIPLNSYDRGPMAKRKCTR